MFISDGNVGKFSFASRQMKKNQHKAMEKKLDEFAELKFDVFSELCPATAKNLLSEMSGVCDNWKYKGSIVWLLDFVLFYSIVSRFAVYDTICIIQLLWYKSLRSS